MQDYKEIKEVALVGTGNIAWHLGHAFLEAGISVSYVISRSIGRAAELAKELAAIPIDHTNLDNISPDLFLLCVNDDALQEVQAQYIYRDALVAHTSGSTGLDIFDADGSAHGVFYPLQTFTRGNRMSYERIPFLVEGSDIQTAKALKELASKISGIVHEVDSGKRRKIHVAAVFACNFNNHLATIAESLMEENGLEFKLLLPLIEETTRKLEHMQPSMAQTGPAARGDMHTIEKHISALQDRPVEQQLYQIITDHIIQTRKTRNE